MAKTPFLKKGDESFASGEDAASWVAEEEGGGDSLPDRLGRRTSLQLFSPVAGERNAYKRQHRRNAAGMRINTADLGDLVGDELEPPPLREGPTILSPKPISPARQLKLKNSVPRLMKALPPLPGEIAEKGGDEPPASGDPPSTRILSSTGFPDRAFCAEDGPSEGKGALPPMTRHCGVDASPRKFKVRVRTSSSPSRASDMGSRSGSLEHDLPRPMAAAKPKLKLKLSRSQLGHARRPGQGGSVFRGNRLKQCNSLADLASHSVRKRYTGQCFCQDMTENRPRSAAGQDVWGPKDGNQEEPDPSPQPSDPFNIPYPPSPDGAEEVMRSSASTNKATLSEMRSFNSDVNPVGHRGLRQKLSMFRLRFGTTPTSSAPRKGEATRTVDQHGATGPAGAGGEGEGMHDGESGGESRSHAMSARPERVGGRVRKWANDAKEAVRSYVRKTLDRSSRLSG